MHHDLTGWDLPLPTFVVELVESQTFQVYVVECQTEPTLPITADVGIQPKRMYCGFWGSHQTLPASDRLARHDLLV